MDMVFNYLPDVFSYQSFRHYNYDNSWLNETTNKDNRVQYANSRPRKSSPRDSYKDTKDSCPICQERQRRPLATYIRSKSRQDHKDENSILEEECENEETPEGASALEEKTEASVTSQQKENTK